RAARVESSRQGAAAEEGATLSETVEGIAVAGRRPGAEADHRRRALSVSAGGFAESQSHARHRELDGWTIAYAVPECAGVAIASRRAMGMGRRTPGLGD